MTNSLNGKDTALADPRREPISPWLNPVTRALRAGRVAVGACAISFPGAVSAQIFGRAGFSFYYFDMEHSSLSIDAVAPIATAAKLAGIVPIAGPSGIADFLVSRTLDNGAMGVIVPHVTSRAEAELVVAASLYAPDGSRGLLNFGALTDFEMADAAEWVTAINRETLVAVKVESEAGINNIEAIASVPGLSAILIGPGDLSASLGIPGAPLEHPRMVEAIEATVAACARNGIAGGPHVSTQADLATWVERGARFFSFSFDGALLLDGSRQAVCAAREVVGAQLL
jgi:4-hydroxy-2-oxoheptanedioate aldolase